MNTSRIASKTVRSLRSGRRETHSAYKTIGILHALRQTLCGQRIAAAKVKINRPHLCLFFPNFFVHFI
ncbi:unnamed protein product [Bemisia tabaci]|uniref:Uncharacterized protein n=1 Tax=Bemisia tabaci TaxID=7038 RepID=A0AAI8Y667_BEMTA|nr:unnamed protein product [Bemisia tabaci]